MRARAGLAALATLLPVGATSFTQEVSPAAVLRKEGTFTVASQASRLSARKPRGAQVSVAIDAEAQLEAAHDEVHRPGTLVQLHHSAGHRDLSGSTMYTLLLVVILTGIALGVAIPIAVNYYYDEIATPPWLRDLMNDLARRPETEPSPPGRSSAAADRSRGREEDIYARSPYESPRARRPRSSSSQRRRRARAAPSRGPASPQAPENAALETSAGEADVSSGRDETEKAQISFASLPKVPLEHPKQISSDEGGPGDSPEAAARLRRLRNEWLQATATESVRGVTQKRVSEESTTAAEDSASSLSSSLHRTVARDSRRGRSPEEPQSPKSSSSKRTVSFDNKVEVKNLEAEQPMRKRTDRSGSGQQRSPKKEDPSRRGVKTRSRSPGGTRKA